MSFYSRFCEWKQKIATLENLDAHKNFVLHLFTYAYKKKERHVKILCVSSSMETMYVRKKVIGLDTRTSCNISYALLYYESYFRVAYK